MRRPRPPILLQRASGGPRAWGCWYQLCHQSYCTWIPLWNDRDSCRQEERLNCCFSRWSQQTRYSDFHVPARWRRKQIRLMRTDRRWPLKDHRQPQGFSSSRRKTISAFGWTIYRRLPTEWFGLLHCVCDGMMSVNPSFWLFPALCSLLWMVSWGHTFNYT